jgi:hypothetical protein
MGKISRLKENRIVPLEKRMKAVEKLLVELVGLKYPESISGVNADISGVYTDVTIPKPGTNQHIVNKEEQDAGETQETHTDNEPPAAEAIRSGGERKRKPARTVKKASKGTSERVKREEPAKKEE